MSQDNTAANPAETIPAQGTLYVGFLDAVKQAGAAANATGHKTMLALYAGIPLIAHEITAGTFKAGRGGTVSKLKSAFTAGSERETGMRVLKYALRCVDGGKNAEAVAGCKEAKSADEAKAALDAVLDATGKPVLTTFREVTKHYAESKDGGDDPVAKLVDRVMDLKPADRARFKSELVKAEKESAANAKDIAAKRKAA